MPTRPIMRTHSRTLSCCTSLRRSSFRPSYRDLISRSAHSYGTPSILSSYSYTNTDDGAPNNGLGSCSGDGSNKNSNGGWWCQHRWTSVAGMVSFWNAVGSEPIVGWVTNGGSRVAFGRGKLAVSYRGLVPDGDLHCV